MKSCIGVIGVIRVIGHCSVVPAENVRRRGQVIGPRNLQECTECTGRAESSRVEQSQTRTMF